MVLLSCTVDIVGHEELSKMLISVSPCNTSRMPNNGIEYCVFVWC
jgi:hypothetical protein